MTPMQEQYYKIKDEYADAIVLFRLGDFFEAFNEDAVTLSKTLGITLTGRGKDEERHPMAGIPHHALRTYLPKLIEAGFKIAIADQMEDPVPGKLVERKVTKLITPGTVLDENSLDGSKNNYIACILIIEGKERQIIALVYCDLSTGELKAFEASSPQALQIELNKIKPAEIVCKASQLNLISNIFKTRLEIVDDKKFYDSSNQEKLLEQFGVASLKGFGIDQKSNIVNAASVLIEYLKECQKTDIKHIKSISLYNYDNYMHLDPETIRNLELLLPISGLDQTNTLYNILNDCKNSMGKRKLRQWILNPLVNLEMLEDRLNAVEFFYNDRVLTSEIQNKLSNTGDLERITGRIGVEAANPKDIVALKYTIIEIQEILQSLEKTNLPSRLKHLLATAMSNSNVYQNIIDLINKSINDDAPAVITEGGIIKNGYNQNIDKLNNLSRNSKQILLQIQQREIQRTGINSLKISYNSVFGYYIEVTKSHFSKVPQDYIRKQTLANAERYITEELKELETRILSAEEKLVKLEQEVFINVRSQIAEFSKDLLILGDIVAEVDVLCNFGNLAREYRYIKPMLKKSSDSNVRSLTIKNGRHPVVEKLTQNFTPNTTEFTQDFIHILTGPNMSGKSTYIRQTALITLMAQIGSFVPADSMEFSIVDRIFTRVGASDNLAKGESTFMVEMTETANILNNATADSLIILDEVGRGTSTYDGVAIAWSIIEHIYDKLKCKTLFATHYHELIELEKKYKGIKNYNVEVVDNKGEIMFKHKIIPGSTSRSYGVHVAKLAGIPQDVIKRADEILKEFEGNGSKKSDKQLEMVQDKSQKSYNRVKTNKTSVPKPKKIHPEQLGLI